MSKFTRRDSIKLAAATLAGGVGAALAPEAQALIPVRYVKPTGPADYPGTVLSSTDFYPPCVVCKKRIPWSNAYRVAYSTDQHYRLIGWTHDGECHEKHEAASWQAVHEQILTLMKPGAPVDEFHTLLPIRGRAVMLAFSWAVGMNVKGYQDVLYYTAITTLRKNGESYTSKSRLDHWQVGEEGTREEKLEKRRQRLADIYVAQLMSMEHHLDD